MMTIVQSDHSNLVNKQISTRLDQENEIFQRLQNLSRNAINLQMKTFNIETFIRINPH